MFGTGISPSDVHLSSGNNNLVVTVQDPANPAAADQVIVQDWTNSNNSIESFAFADGTSWNMTAMLLGTAGSDQLYGGTGANALFGAAGNDTYIIDNPGDAAVEYAGEGLDTVQTALAFYVLAANIENLAGTAASGQTLSGNGLNNVISGGPGSDTLHGGGGDDLLNPGASGADLIDGGPGTDTVSYAGWASGMIVDLMGQATWDGSVGDTLSSIENAIGSPLNDKFVSNAQANRFDGGAGIDTVSYSVSGSSVIVDLVNQISFDGAVNDTLSSIENAVGSNFSDTFYSNAAANRFDGGAGIDTVSYTASSTGVIIDLIAQAAYDGAFGDTLSGIENATGSSYNDFLYGDGGNNLLDGGPGGADFISGGAGIDTVSYASSAGGVIVDLASQGAWDGVTSDTLSSIENAIGSPFNDTFYSNAGANSFAGGAGADTVSYAASSTGVIVDLFHQATSVGTVGDTLSSIENAVGSNFNDTFYSNAGANSFAGGAGTDTVSYSASSAGVIVDLFAQASWDGSVGDTLSGIENATGSGFNDTFYSNAGANSFAGGAGFDTVSYSASASGVIVDLFHQASWDGTAGDTLSSIENATGSNFNDTFYSNAGANAFAGGAGIDTVSYSASSAGVIVDLILQATYDGSAGDTLSGIENATGSSKNDSLYGDAGNNLLDGGSGGIDFISGGAGTDTVSCASSATAMIVDLIAQATWDGSVGDTLSSIENAIGSAFNDALYGNGGDNVLDGGLGIDTLSGGAGNDSFVFRKGQASGDIVVDFGGNGAAAGDQLQFTGYGTAAQGATLTAVDATHWSINSADGLVHDIITLANGAGIHASDYLFA